MGAEEITPWRSVSQARKEKRNSYGKMKHLVKERSISMKNEL